MNGQTTTESPLRADVVRGIEGLRKSVASFCGRIAGIQATVPESSPVWTALMGLKQEFCVVLAQANRLEADTRALRATGQTEPVTGGAKVEQLELHPVQQAHQSLDWKKRQAHDLD